MNVIAELQEVVWTLPEGIDTVRTLQPRAKDFGYHVALGGGTLNKGYSKKDLDLYFLPLDGGSFATKPELLLDWLSTVFGSFYRIDEPRYNGTTRFTYKVCFENNGKRIDAFIL